MKNILVGNGINIQYDKVNCAPKNIVLRMLLSFDDEDFPCDYIVDDPMLLKIILESCF